MRNPSHFVARAHSGADVLHITPEAHALLAKSTVRPGMVLLTMSGSVGNAAVALEASPENWRNFWRQSVSH